MKISFNVQSLCSPLWNFLPSRQQINYRSFSSGAKEKKKNPEGETENNCESRGRQLINVAIAL